VPSKIEPKLKKKNMQPTSTANPTSAPQDKDARARPPALADRVYEQIAVRIASGEFRANTKLPSENDLSAILGVSRPILRLALQKLRTEGIIVARQGAGNFVRDRAGTVLSFSPVETIADIQRCYEFRLTIEPIAAREAARRSDAQARDKMTDALELLQDATRNKRHREDADFSFHLAVAEGSNNHYFSSTMLALREHIYVGMHMHGLSLMGAQTKLQHVLGEHRSIYDAIKNQDLDSAEKLMRRHLEGSRDRLFEGRLLDLKK
jgi:GntR family transcriptional regulator, transcriptional repressor for pyruvate dehydrogenase complex